MKVQRGGFAIGLVVGLLVGLALALGVALYITKVPVPFVNKVPQRTPEQDRAEAERNKTWNPNAPLAPSGASAAASAAAGSPPAVAPGRDPAAILSGAPVPPVSTASAPEPFTYLVQVGAYTRETDAEAQRAKLAMQGLTARITEREQAGRTVYRVRLGPFDRKAEAEAIQQRLKETGMEGQLVRVQRP
jgi:cell division protein FtsN